MKRTKKNDLGEAINDYKWKIGDTLIESVVEAHDTFIGSSLDKEEISYWNVTHISPTEITIASDGKEKKLDKAHLSPKGGLYLHEKMDGKKYRNTCYKCVPVGFKPCNYEEISKSLAENAFSGTSFSPEKRGEQYRKEWAADVNNLALLLDQKSETTEQREKAIQLHNGFHDKSKSLFEAYLSAHSRCISTMITGGSKFPTKRAERANQAADEKMDDYNKYVKNAFLKYPEIIKKTLTQEEEERGMTYAQKEFFEKLDKDIRIAKEIAAKPRGTVPSYIKTNMNNALIGRLETLWKNRDYKTFNLALDKIKEAGCLFDKKNAIWERHANTKTEDLYQTNDLSSLLKLIDHLFSISEDGFKKERETYDYFIRSRFSTLLQQHRIRSIEIALNKIKNEQERTGFTLIDPNSHLWKYTKHEEDVTPTAENPHTSTIFKSDGCEIVDNIEAERVQIFFPGKPEREIISDLKSNGFKWAPSIGAWQRQNTPEGRRKALEFAKKYFKEEENINEDREKRKRLGAGRAKAILILQNQRNRNALSGFPMYDLD